MPLTMHPTTEDGRLVRDKNVLKALHLLYIFGHLRRSELARYVWPRSTERSAYLMACRTTKQMLERGLVLEKSNAFGGTSLVLALKGANMLREQGFLDATEGYDLSPDGPQFFHRMLGTNYLLEKLRGGAEVYSEYSLIRGKSPVSVETLKERYNKAPDGLVVYDGRLHGMREGWYQIDWVEVESAYKPYREVKKALQLLLQNDFELKATSPGKDYVLNHLVFVYDARQKHEKWLLAAIRRWMRETQADYGTAYNPNQLLKEIWFAACHIDYPLSVRGFEERCAIELMSNADLSAELPDDAE